MIYEYILNNYKEIEPIFVCDLPTFGNSKSALTQQLNTLCKKEKLCKYENGVYYIPKRNELNIIIGPTAELVAKYKYVCNGSDVKGYYTGHTLANQLGLTSQVPRIVEIVTNDSSAKYRKVKIGNRFFAIRKSSLQINSNNVYTLQFLDFLKNINLYIDGEYEDAKPKVYEFIRNHNITKMEIDKYIRNYPVTIFKNYYEMGLQDVFA